jgi:ABC-type transporter Mla MlaB component
MHVALHQNGLTLVRCYGELSLEELARVAAAAARARAEGRMAVVDLGRVTHLHYAGARLLADVPGLRAAGASRYVRDLLRAGAGAVDLYRDVGEAFGAA